MPIVDSEIQFRLSGGASNSDPNASIGGAKSSNVQGTNLFDQVESAEAAAGRVEYRCIYIHNANGTLTMQNSKIWIEANTPSPGTQIDVGVGAAAVGGTETAVANETTAPSGVTFASAPNEGAALALGDIPAGSHRGVWLRRTVVAGTAAAADSATYRAKCDTAA
jgi:hypothetical protein